MVGNFNPLNWRIVETDPWSKVVEDMVEVVATRPPLDQDHLEKKHFRFKISIHAYLVLFCYAVLSIQKLQSIAATIPYFSLAALTHPTPSLLWPSPRSLRSLRSPEILHLNDRKLSWNWRQFKEETLPEAQRTQGIASLTWVIAPAKKNITCIGSKSGQLYIFHLN